MIDLSKYGYYDTGLTLDDNTHIFMSSNIRRYSKPIYKTFIDKETNEEVEIQTGNEIIDYIFDKNHITIRNNFAHHNIIQLSSFTFSFNFKYYYCFCNIYDRPSSIVNSIICREQNEDIPEHAFDTSYFIIDAMNTSGYYPLIEQCFSTSHSVIRNYLTDKFFFNYPNRKHALDNLAYISKKIFEDVDYVNMNDYDLLNFMNERFDKRIKFERLIKHPPFKYTFS